MRDARHLGSKGASHQMTTVVLELERDEAIALEAEAKITLEGIFQLTNPSPEALRCRERLARAHQKLRTVLDEQERTLWGGEGRDQ